MHKIVLISTLHRKINNVELRNNVGQNSLSYLLHIILVSSLSLLLHYHNCFFIIITYSWQLNSKSCTCRWHRRNNILWIEVVTVTKPIKYPVYPVWAKSSLYVQWVAQVPRFLDADSGSLWSDWAEIPRLIWVFAGRTAHFVGFVVRRPNYFDSRKYGCIIKR